MSNQENKNTCTKDEWEELCGFPEKIQRPYIEALNKIGLTKYFCIDCLLAEIDPIMRVELVVTENLINNMRSAFSAHPEMRENEFNMNQYLHLLMFWEHRELAARKKIRIFAGKPENFLDVCRILVELEGKKEKCHEFKAD
jgi:hypothetical protein